MKKTKEINTELFDQYINSSGYKISYIVDRLGISRQAFDNKRKGKMAFRASEVFVLCTLFNISDEETKNKIFYP